jgi:hypothetical protein
MHSRQRDIRYQAHFLALYANDAAGRKPAGSVTTVGVDLAGLGWGCRITPAANLTYIAIKVIAAYARQLWDRGLFDA